MRLYERIGRGFNRRTPGVFVKRTKGSALRPTTPREMRTFAEEWQAMTSCYFLFRRRSTSAAPRPASPVARSAKLSGSGTTALTVAFACTGKSNTVTANKSSEVIVTFMMRTPRKGYVK